MPYLPVMIGLTTYLTTIACLLVVGITLIIWLNKRSRERLRWVQLNLLVASLVDIEEVAILVDERGIVEFINPAAERLLNCRLTSVRGRHYSAIAELLDPIQRTPITWLKPSTSNTTVLHYKNCILRTRDITELKTTYASRSIKLDTQKKNLHVLLLRDQAEILALQAKLDYLEMHDQQTGLLNRKCFEIQLKIALDQARQQGIKHSFMHIALDRFKMINDNVGHSAGDVFIERMAELLKHAINPQRDILARLGGDEFGILFRELEPVDALKLAEQIKHQIAAFSFYWNSGSHKITASIGFIPIYKRSGTPNRILSLADASCRVAKAKGGNHLHIYRPNDSEVQRHRGQLVWLVRLQKALEASQFRLVAQPIQPLNKEQFALAFHHYEVLLRLFDEHEQPISPDEFIPAAEYYSMMPRVDRWVIHALLQELKRINQFDPLPVFAINLSGQSLDDPTFLVYVLDEIRTSQINPAMLCFEITERVAIGNVALAQKFISTLKKQGCYFSLDDFGTGVSSFGYLKSLPVNYLKIDGSFIKDIANDAIAHTMVQSIQQVGQKMRVQIIAEYVENESIIHILRDIGVEFGQGYGISRPIPLAKVIDSHIIK